MQEQTENKPQAKKLFGIGNPILKALLIIIFVLLTGGLGFIIVALAFVGDHLLSKSKKIPPQSLSVVLAALILVGCATEKVEKGLHLLQGEKLSTAISYLGYPDSKLEIEGKTIYQWGYDNTFTGVQAVSQPFSGSVYGAGGVVGYSGQSTVYMPQTIRHHCTIRLMTDKSGVIVGSAWKGNNAGCKDYAEGLEKLIATQDSD